MSPRIRTVPTVVLLLGALSASSGCLRQRRQATDESFRDLPAIPKQDFGRPSEQRGQVGIDDRSRQIEASLGIEGGPPRFFDR